MHEGLRIVPLGDSCLSMEFDERIDEDINARCVGIADALRTAHQAGIRDVGPGFYPVAVHFDPRRVNRRELSNRLEQAAAAVTRKPSAPEDVIEVAVEYGSESGPDLAAVAAFAGCTEDEVVRIHTERVYRVYMLGFLPGFAYLATVDRRLPMPRLDTPRLRVEAGAVGIAREQTGIYPCDTPGGWRIIGRARVRPFDLARPQPFLFKPGQRVRFVAV